MAHETRHLKGLLYLFAGYAAYSVSDAISKYAGRSIDTPTTLFYIYSATLVLLVIFSPWLGGLRSVTITKKLKLHVVRGLFFTLGALLFITAIQHTALAKAYTILFTFPFISTVLAGVLLREAMTWRRWLPIVAGFFGVLIVLRPGLLAPDPLLMGVLAAAASFGLFIIATRKIGAAEPWINFALFPVLTTAAAMFILTLHRGTPLLVDPHLLPWLIVGGFGILIAMLLTARGFTLVPVAIGTPVQYSQLIWGTLFGYFFFGETPDIWTAVGGSVIVASGLFLIRQESGETRRQDG